MAATVAGLQESFIFRHLTGVFAASGDKDVPGMLAELEPVLDEIVVTRNSSERSMDPAETAELAAEIFGEERVARPTGSMTRSRSRSRAPTKPSRKPARAAAPY